MSKLILHVDDEPEIRELLQAALAASGFRILSVPSALEAIRAVEAEKPDLLIADMQLADRDGLELIREVKGRHPDLPVMMLTGVLIDPRIAQKSLGSLVDVYLSKTTPLNRITAELHRLLRE